MRELKVNTGALGYIQGSVVKIHCDSTGNPMEKFWRDRLRDAKTDNCVQWVNSVEVKEHKQPVETKEYKQIKESKKESKK